MFNKTVSAVAAALLATGTVALSTPAWAAEFDEDSVSVRVGDLDLGTAKGAARLDRRIRAAAREICGAVPNQDLAMQAMVESCQARVISGAAAEKRSAVASASGRGEPLVLGTR